MCVCVCVCVRVFVFVRVLARACVPLSFSPFSLIRLFDCYGIFITIIIIVNIILFIYFEWLYLLYVKQNPDCSQLYTYTAPRRLTGSAGFESFQGTQPMTLEYQWNSAKGNLNES